MSQIGSPKEVLKDLQSPPDGVRRSQRSRKKKEMTEEELMEDQKFWENNPLFGSRIFYFFLNDRFPLHHVP